MSRQNIKMGDEYRDKVTGYQGIVIAKYEFISGCVQYHLQLLDKDGKITGETFDEQRLEKVKAKPAIRRHRTGADTAPPSAPVRA